MKTSADIKWDKEHELFKGTYFGKLTINRKRYTLMKGRLANNGFSIGGTFDGEYNEFDFDNETELNELIMSLQ